MRKIYSLLFGLLLPIFYSSAQGVSDDFNDGVLDPAVWQATSRYQMSEANGALAITCNKSGFDGFNYQIAPVTAPLNLSANPYVNVKIKATKSMVMQMWMWDVNGKYTTCRATQNFNVIQVLKQDDYQTFSFNFKNRFKSVLGTGCSNNVDSTKIIRLLIVFQPDLGYTGTVYFDEIKVGDQAQPLPNIAQVMTQNVYINSGAQTINLREITDGGARTQPITVTATSSNPAVVPNPTVGAVAFNSVYGSNAAVLTYTPVANAVGTTTISVKASSQGVENVTTFNINVNGNKAPKLDSIPNQATVPAGVPTVVKLSGIADGNPEVKQLVSVWGTSSNQAILPNNAIVFNYYADGDPNGLLTITPVSNTAGTVTVTVNLKDNGGQLSGGVDWYQRTFTITVFKQVNNAPKIDNIADQPVIIKNTGTFSVPLTGIDDGDASASQTLSITAVSSNPSAVPNPVISYTPGSTTGTLTYSTLKADSAIITVTVTDAGANVNNNGNVSKEVKFTIYVRPIPLPGYAELFGGDAKTASRWRDADYHVSTEANGELSIVVDKPGFAPDFWEGCTYYPPGEVDMKANPYISFKLKSSVATKIRLFIFDVNFVYNTAQYQDFDIPGDDTYRDYFFDFTNRLQNGGGKMVDLTRVEQMQLLTGIQAALKGTVTIKELNWGSMASNKPVVLPKVTMDAVADRSVYKGSGSVAIKLKNIGDGAQNTNAVTLSVQSTNTAIIATPTLTPISGGEATLTFTAGATVGYSNIIVTAAANGSASRIDTFRVNVADDNTSGAAMLTLNLNTKYQTIEGFGVFQDSDHPSFIDLAIKDLGATIFRTGVSERFEVTNDNNDPKILNRAGLDYSQLSIPAFMKMKSLGVTKWISTVWCGPIWMKKNLSAVAARAAAPKYEESRNIIDPYYFDEYAEFIYAYITVVKEQTGVELFGISIQNEPGFDQQYVSAVLSPTAYRDLVKVVGKRLKDEGVKTKIFMPEQVFAQGTHGYSMAAYAAAIINDAEANQYVDIVATHSYAVVPKTATQKTVAAQWQDLYTASTQGSRPKQLWVTETSGNANSWKGAIGLANEINNALKYGKISGNVWWTLQQGISKELEGLIVGPTPSSRYYTSKNFYRFIRPGAVQVDISSPAATDSVLVTAFNHEADQTLSIVFVNNSTAPKVYQLNGTSIPSFRVFRSAENMNCEEVSTINNNTVLLPPSSVVTLIGGQNVGSVLSVENPAAEKTVSVYPVPAKNQITVVRPDLSFNRLSIVDMLGRTVVSKNVISGDMSVNVDIQHLESGIYILSVSNGNEILRKKFVVE